jgi:hypothetical protein
MNTSCFACRGSKCRILLSEHAHCEGCRFFKSKTQAVADREHALDLIAAKPPEQQQYIADKYFYGKMPWKDGDGYDD